MIRVKDAKSKALSRLSDCWGKAAAVVFFLLLIDMTLICGHILAVLLLSGAGILEAQVFPNWSGVLWMVNLLFYILRSLLLSPAKLGGMGWFLYSIRGEENPVRSIFIFFSSLRRYWRAVWITLLVGMIRLAAAAPLCGGVYLLLLLIRRAVRYNSAPLVVLSVLAGILCLCLLGLFVWFSLRFSAASCLFTLNPERSAWETVGTSWKMMRGRESQLVKLAASFGGWFVLCLLVFPIIFVIPYYLMAYCALMNRIITETGSAVGSA